MAADRDDRRDDAMIDAGQGEFLVNEHDEGGTPAGARPTEGPRGGRGGDATEGGRAGAGVEPGGSVSVLNLVVTAAIALIFGLVGAWAFDAFAGGMSGEEARVADGQGEGAQGAGALPADDQSVDGARGMAGEGTAAGEAERVDQLVEEVARLRERVESRPEPSPDGQPEEIRARLDDLSGRLESVEGLSQQLRERSERMDAMSERLDDMESQLAMRDDGVGEADGGADRPPVAGDASPTEARRQALRPQPEGEGEADADAAMERGILQFKSDDFEAARDTFSGLLELRPDDARAWYYAALASGKATGDWGGEAERLVLEGVGRERAGTPPRAEIDAAFDDLTERQGGEWLRFYRRRAGD